MHKSITDDYGNTIMPAHVRTIYERMDAFEGRFDAGEVRMTSIEAGLLENNVATAQVKEDTAELLDILGALKGGLKVLEGIGKLAKPFTAIIGLGVAIWSAYVAFRSGGIGPK